MPEEKWFVTTKKADFNHIAAEFGISPVLARIIRNRDIVTEEEVRYFLHGTLEDLHDPYLLKGMREGSAFLYAAIREKKQIRIIGDYDVDPAPDQGWVRTERRDHPGVQRAAGRSDRHL